MEERAFVEGTPFPETILSVSTNQVNKGLISGRGVQLSTTAFTHIPLTTCVALRSQFSFLNPASPTPCRSPFF